MIAQTDSLDESFLPQIIGIFYAVFDPHRGPIVTNQVPEKLITTGATQHNSSQLLPHGSDPSLDPTLTSSVSSLSSVASVPPPQSVRGRSSRNSLRAQADSLSTTPFSQQDRSLASSPARSSSRLSLKANSPSPTRTHRTASIRSASPAFNPYGPSGLEAANADSASPASLLDFALVSDYIVPRSALKYRLVTCHSGRFQILGFPCVIDDERYERNELKWNLAFVFDRRADLSAFEPVVRKCGRLLRSCELDNKYLSSPQSPLRIQSVIEQLFEDLNSYSETSILIDGVNGIEIKLFPFHPNPPLVENWHVPVPLVDLSKLKESNWDLMAARVVGFIDGVNHAGRIAQLVDADPRITRLCLQHLLFYQVIAMIDIFQYTNMYTVKPAIQRISREESVSTECGLYVTREFHPVPSWPVLLQLYAGLVPGISVSQWMEQNCTEARGLDVRRFITFGIIKGFLRRVHRWPILADSATGGGPLGNGLQQEYPSPNLVTRSSEVRALGPRRADSTDQQAGQGGVPSKLDSTFTLRSSRSNNSLDVSSFTKVDHIGSIGRLTTPASAMNDDPGKASTSVHSWGTDHRGSTGFLGTSQVTSSSVQPERSFASHQPGSDRAKGDGTGYRTASHMGTAEKLSGAPSASDRAHKDVLASHGVPPASSRRARHPSLRAGPEVHLPPDLARVVDLLALRQYLDGNHHADEIQTIFNLSWRGLEACLRIVGGVISDAGRMDGHQERNVARNGTDTVANGQCARVVIVCR